MFTTRKPRLRQQQIGTAIAVLLCIGLLSTATAAALPSSFGTEGEGSGQISNPQGVAVDQETGDVYVGDARNGRVDKFGPQGEFLLAWGWGVADGKTKALQTCTTTCFKGLAGAGTGEFANIFGAEGIAVNNDPFSPSHGDVYVVDSRNLRVQKFDPEGHFLTMFGREVNATTKGDVCNAGEACQAGIEVPEGSVAGPGEFRGLTGHSVAVDSEGTVYVGDENRVQRFGEEGVVVGEVVIPGAGRIEKLAVDSVKDIYVHGALQEGVHKYDATGKELGAPREETGYGPAHAISIGPANGLFVNDFQSSSHHILRFDPEGKQFASFDSGGSAQDGERGIAYSEFTKALYVLNQGLVRIVTPPPPGPFVLLGSETASKVEPASAKLEAMVNPEGPEGATEASHYHFEYGTSVAYGQSTPEAELPGGLFEDQPAGAAVAGLAPSTTYHFRVVAKNSAKEVTDGPDQTFTTLPPVSIDSTSVSQVNATSARLEAELNPHGVASRYRFEYLTDAEFKANGESFTGAAKPVLVPSPPEEGNAGAGTTDTTVQNVVQELLPSTTYHYRVVARNALNEPGEYVIGPERSFTTQGTASILADGRQWELVSPPNKHGSPLEPITEEGGLLQAAADGGGFAYVALGPINGEAKGVRSPHDSQLLATRGSKGWSTQDITTPHEEISIIHVGFPTEYKFFSDDLSSSVVAPEGVTRLDPGNPANTERTPYRREANGAFLPLVTSENVPSGTKFGGVETPGTGEWSNGVEFETATPDLSHVVLVSSHILAPGFKPGFEPNGQSNLYELAGGKLTLVSVLPNEEPTSESGLAVGVGQGGKNMRGAISNDGGRIVFEAGPDLYLRDADLGKTVQLDDSQPGAAGGAGKATFQVASSDGGKIFFTDASRLTTDSTAKPQSEPDLYMCEVGESEGRPTCTLSDLSVDHNAGEAADVQGDVSAIDAAGGHVYFAANGVLTSTPNTHGEVATAGNCESPTEAPCNLYEYNTSTRQIVLVAVLSSLDAPDWMGKGNLEYLGNLTARSAPDGQFYSFMSRRSLTGYDNRDAHSGKPDEEVFQFNAASSELSCISCNPTGARPDGVFDRSAFPGLLVDHPKTWGFAVTWLAASIPGWDLISGGAAAEALYQSRYLSDTGREFFNSSDALVPQDTNNVNDVYEFEPSGVGDCTTSSRTYSPTSGGCVSLISSGTSKEESTFLDATENGNEVFFLTASKLSPLDVDTAFDVYDAHVCSAESPCPPPPPPPPPACQGDACQNPVAAPNDATPGSLTFHGPGNVTPVAVKKATVKAKPLTRAEKLARALKACKAKKNKRKRQACEKVARKSFGPLKKAKKKK